MESVASKTIIYSGEWGEIFDQMPWLQYQLAGVELWLWVAIPALFFLSYVLARLLISLIFIVTDKLGLVEHGWLKRYVFSITDPLALLLAGITFNAVQKLLPIGVSTEITLSYFNSTIYTVAISWILVVYVNKTLDVVRKRLLREGRASSSALIPLLNKIVNTAIFVLALLFLLQNIGFDVAALIAALGIGGVAVALASQKSVESLLGGIIISLDQPIRVGELGKFGDRIGTVEDIGLRSTRIRTLDHTLLSIPNADMASMRLENISARAMMLFEKTIGLRPETDLEQTRHILAAVRGMLRSHAMLSERPRFHLIAYGPSSIDFEIGVSVKTGNKENYLEVQEDLLLKIREIVQKTGTDFAFPAPPVYIERAEIAGQAPAKGL